MSQLLIRTGIIALLLIFGYQLLMAQTSHTNTIIAMQTVDLPAVAATVTDIAIPTKANVKEEPTGIANLEAAYLHVYPNPSDGQVNIEVNQVTTPYTLQILGMDGALVYESKIHAPAKQHMVQLDELNAGIYFVQLHAAEKMLHKRIIIR